MVIPDGARCSRNNYCCANSSPNIPAEPRIEIPSPANLADAATNIGTDTINDVEFVETAAQYTGVVESNGDGRVQHLMLHVTEQNIMLQLQLVVQNTQD